MSNASKGAAFENKVKNILISKGFVAVRSAGSHGIVDILAVCQEQILFIQCKTNGKISKDDRQELISLARHHGAMPIIAFKDKRTTVLKELEPDFNASNFEIIDNRVVERTLSIQTDTD